MPVIIHNNILHMIALITYKVKGSIMSPRNNHLRHHTPIRDNAAMLPYTDMNGVLSLSESHHKSMIRHHTREQVTEGGLVGSL